MGTPTGRRTVSLDEAAQQAEQAPSDHVQSIAERALARYPAAADHQYVRGCAGFAGFAPGSLSVHAVETFSTQMEALVGRAKWREWGSEQVTSNFLIANMPGAQVLPVERYPFWAPGRSLADSALVHFFGKFRFTGGMYHAHARRLIGELRA